MTGVGMYGANLASVIILGKWGASLPGYIATGATAPTKNTVALYSAGISILLGALVRKKYPDLSNGAYLAGISSLLNNYVTPAIASSVNSTVGTAVLPTSAYIRRGSPLSGVGRLPGPRNHTAVDQFSNFPGQKALFATNAWARGGR